MINEEINIPAGLLKYERRMKGQYRGIRQWIDRLAREDKIQEIYNSNQWDKMSKAILKAYDNHCVICDKKFNSHELNVINLSDITIYPMNAFKPVLIDLNTFKARANIIPICSECYKKSKKNKFIRQDTPLPSHTYLRKRGFVNGGE